MIEEEIEFCQHFQLTKAALFFLFFFHFDFFIMSAFATVLGRQAASLSVCHQRGRAVKDRRQPDDATQRTSEIYSHIFFPIE